MTVTATARTSEPNGSPTRCATTSAWWTAARTAAASTTATTATTTYEMSWPQVSARRQQGGDGGEAVQLSSARRVEAAMGLSVS